MNNFTNMEDIFDHMFGDIDYVDSMNIYPFKIRCGVIKYRPPRHEFFQWIKEMGANYIDPIFKAELFNPPETLTFVFPEKYMSVHEEIEFMVFLKDHPEVDKIKQVDILTKSAILLSSFTSDMIRIITWPDDKNCVGYR